MKHWLVKSEPSAYSWTDLVRDGRTFWDGVRNFQARNNLRAMTAGDRVLVYHSVTDKEVVGIARVAKEAYQDPTTDDERWVVVDLEPLEPLAQPVTLAAIKAEPTLRNVALLKQSRLSVLPLTAAEFAAIVKLAGKGNATAANRGGTATTTSARGKRPSSGAETGHGRAPRGKRDARTRR
jgi:predicted RNA-binding protein with PUA-like domain